VLLPFGDDPASIERSLKWYTPDDPPFGGGRVFVRQLPSPQATRQGLEALGLAGRPLFVFLPKDDGLGGRFAAVDL
jgi:hypothetical protein